MIGWTARWIRRVVVGLIGALVLVTGLLRVVLPGPAVVVIPLGLAILSLEFAWARYLLRRLRDRVGLGQNGQAEKSPAEPPASDRQ